MDVGSLEEIGFVEKEVNCRDVDDIGALSQVSPVEAFGIELARAQLVNIKLPLTRGSDPWPAQRLVHLFPCSGRDSLN